MMKRMRAVFTALSLLVCALPSAFGAPLGAQVEGPGRLSFKAAFTPASAKAGDEVKLILTLSIDPAWHVYGKKEPYGEAPSFTLDDVKGLTAVGVQLFPDGEEHIVFDIKSYWAKGKVELVQKYKLAKDAKAGPLEFKGKLRYTACNDKICEPPKSVPFTVSLQILAASPVKAAQQDQGDPLANPLDGIPGFGVQDEGGDRLRIVKSEIKPAKARAGEIVTLEVTVEIDPGWHVYGAADLENEPTVLLVRTGKFEEVGRQELPDGERHEIFGVVAYWVAGRFTIKQDLRIAKDLEPGSYEVASDLSYMACNDSSCDPANRVGAPVAKIIVEQGEARADQAEVKAVPLANEESGDDDDDIGKKSIWDLISLAFFGGLLALIMPCTYPMIPITMSFFTKQAEAKKGSALSLSLVYGVGIIAIFVLIGVIVGEPISKFATHYITNLVIGVLFLVFALALFGVINLQPPRFLMNYASKASMKSGYVGVFLMGATLVVTSFTCTVPFVGLVLAYGAKSGGLALVVLGMGVFGLTMAVPFVILALLPGKLQAMPKSGEWMNTIKVFMGFVEVAAALKFFSMAEVQFQDIEFLPKELFLVLWTGIFAVASAYLFGWIKLKGDSGEIGPGRLSMGVLVSMWTMYLAYGAMGHPMDRYVMPGLLPPYSAGDHIYGPANPGGESTKSARANKHGAKHVIVLDDYDKALAMARLQGRKLLVNFTGYL